MLPIKFRLFRLFPGKCRFFRNSQISKLWLNHALQSIPRPPETTPGAFLGLYLVIRLSYDGLKFRHFYDPSGVVYDLSRVVYDLSGVVYDLSGVVYDLRGSYTTSVGS